MSGPFEIHTEFNGHLTRIYVGHNVTVWFSYGTAIAFAVSGEGTFKSENVWTNTTGKHLNSIPAREVLPFIEFERRLRELAEKINVATKAGA